MKTLPARMTVAEVRAHMEKRKAPKKNRLGNVAKRVDLGGEKFDSRFERNRYAQLLLEQRAGLISGLKRQVRTPLMGRDGPILTPTGRQMAYVADFTYLRGNVLVIEDTKGVKTEVYLMKKAILAAMGITINEVRQK